MAWGKLFVGLISKWHDQIEIVVFFGYLFIGIVLIYLYYSISQDKRFEERHLFFIGIGFLMMGVAAIVNLKSIPLFEPTFAYLLHDGLELGAAIVICYGVTHSLPLLSAISTWGLAVFLFLNVIPLFTFPKWRGSPFPLGGGDYPFEAPEELLGELPLYSLVAILFFVGFLRQKTLPKLFILLGLASLSLVRVGVFAKGMASMPKHNILWAAGHLFKIVALLMFLISFYFIRKKSQLNNHG